MPAIPPAALRAVSLHASVLALAAASGAVAGLASFAFLEALDWATGTRLRHGWLVWLLPLVGLIVGLVYHFLGGRAATGTGLVIREARALGEGVPLRMAPLIFAGTVAGHLFGASVGREGTALQLSGSLTDGVARWAGVDAVRRQTLVRAAVAGGFGAVFGVPLSAVVFAVTVASAWQPIVVVACAVAAIVGDRVVALLGHDHAALPTVVQVPWSAGLVARLVVLGVVCGLAARVFVVAIDQIRELLVRCAIRPWLRPVIGGVSTVLLVVLAGRDYLGLSLPLVDAAFADGDHRWTVPVLKLLFTVIALGTGFVGGEVTPMFVIGAASGGWIAAATGGDAAALLVLVACGFVSVYAAASGTMVAGVVMAAELFGWRAALPAVVVGVVARLAVGTSRLYVSRPENATPPAVAPSPNR